MKLAALRGVLACVVARTGGEFPGPWREVHEHVICAEKSAAYALDVEFVEDPVVDGVLVSLPAVMLGETPCIVIRFPVGIPAPTPSE